MLGGCVLLPAAKGFELLFDRLDDKYTFCGWLALALEEDALRFVGEFFHL